MMELYLFFPLFSFPFVHVKQNRGGEKGKYTETKAKEMKYIFSLFFFCIVCNTSRTIIIAKATLQVKP